MLFNSAPFLFLFLPLALLLFWSLRASRFYKFSFDALLALSVVFYAFWRVEYVFLLGASILVNFIFAKRLQVRPAKFVFGAGVCVNLIVLAYFKYAAFGVEILNDFTHTPFSVPDIILPLGISFFTFQQIAFLYDVYRREFEIKSFRQYALAVTFFPHLIAGPIVMARKLVPQFVADEPKSFFHDMTFMGLCLFVMGLFKKVVIADNMAMYANPLFARVENGITLSFMDAWVAALSYSFQLYFDFSGYSDMALGLGFMFGIVLSVNFYAPYKATNIASFWNRWHISMSNYFRDVVFIPLGGSRVALPRHVLNLMITMFVVGLWHGAGYAFLLWGVYHGVLLSIHAVYRRIFKDALKQVVFNPIYITMSYIVTMIAVVVGWVIFRAKTLDQALSIYSSMSAFKGITIPEKLGFLSDLAPLQGLFVVASPENVWLSVSVMSIPALAICAGIAVLAPCSINVFKLQALLSERANEAGLGRVRFMAWTYNRTPRVIFLFAVMAVAVLFSLQRISEFLYFQF